MTTVRVVAVYELWGLPHQELVPQLVEKGFPTGIAFDIYTALRKKTKSTIPRGWACIDLHDSEVAVLFSKPRDREDEVHYFYFTEWSQVISRMNLLGIRIHETLSMNADTLEIRDNKGNVRIKLGNI